MVRNNLEALQMANAQRERATAEILLKKRRVERTVSFALPDDEGKPMEVELLFRSIGSTDYDNLVTKFPPTGLQKKDGMSYDIDRFAPTLLSRVCVDPDIDVDTWKTIWNSDDWNRGELMSLYLQAVDCCTRGLNVDPTESE